MTEPRRPRRPAPQRSGFEREVYSAALDLLSSGGVAATTTESVAVAAGVPADQVSATWSSAADLMTAAVASLDRGDRPVGSGGAPFDELVSELLVFRRVMAHPSALAVTSAAMDESAQPELARLYRDRILRPQRNRLRRILDQARKQGALDTQDTNLELAVSCCTGSWYALVLAGARPPRDWGSTVARLTWRSLGGQLPD